MSEVVRKFGRLDYGVNCAGILGEGRRSTETTTDTFDHINGVNYRGCWMSSRAQIKQMLRQDPLPSHDPGRSPQRGAVVNIASQLGIVGRPSARKLPRGVVSGDCWANEIYYSFACSGILQFQGRHHRDDSFRCDRLLSGRDPRELCLPRCHRDPHDYMYRRGPRTTAARGRDCADEENGEAGRGGRHRTVPLLYLCLFCPRARSRCGWGIYYQLNSV